MDVVIIEDEQLAAERLELLLDEIDPSIRVLAKLESVATTVDWLRHNTADLLFLDIQLADGLSFDIFEQVEVEAPVIFTTAYDQYAIQAFKHNSIDYLLKPIRKDELQASLIKYNQLQKIAAPDIQKLVHMLQPKPEYKKRFLIQYGERIKKVKIEDVAFFYAMDKCVFLTTFQNHTFTVDFSLDQLQDMIDPDHFFRINRKIMINEDAIKNMVAFSRSRIKIDLHPSPPKGIETIVSTERTRLFKQWMDR